MVLTVQYSPTSSFKMSAKADASWTSQKTNGSYAPSIFTVILPRMPNI
ncbi:hypothetical protein AWB67_06260 [Caballeronia terrestris]|uniref:Uncharacterized protein n=1 Tax=Caballeronia terrestris TaxID=1226301 RepID=A0A158KP57_9BURK|nr:hypothetical protein AWB67_06260 [Caballeronia terrestris]